jgi:hypothetical protein
MRSGGPRLQFRVSLSADEKGVQLTIEFDKFD